MVQYLTTGGPARKFFIFSCSSSIIGGILKPKLRMIQGQALQFMHQTNFILTNYTDATICLVWLPTVWSLKLFADVVTSAEDACSIITTRDNMHTQSAIYRRALSRTEAYKHQSQEWYQKPWTSFVYRHTLTQPPDGKHHPLWRAAIKDDGSCRVTCTTLCHAFHADYTTHYRPDLVDFDPCGTCGTVDHTLTHILYRFPHYHAQRATHNPNWIPLRKLFTHKNFTRDLFCFIAATGATFQSLWERPWPD